MPIITVDASSILINAMKCSAKSMHKPPLCNFRVSVCVGAIFWVRTRVTVYVFSRRKVRRTLYDPYLSVFLAVFLGEVYEKGKGTLAEVGMHF